MQEQGQETSHDTHDASVVSGQPVHPEIDKIKLKFEPWHCDKNPHDFVTFMESMSAVIRSVKHGNELEDYLDVKLERGTYQPMMISAILEADPDFEEPDTVTDPDYATARRLFTSSTPTTVRSVESLRAASQKTDTLPSAGSYFKLSTGALNLDRMLFSVLLTLVIGSKAVLVRCVKRQSYIQGMCLLFKHCDITRNDRIAQAFEKIDAMKYSGDAQAWATMAIGRVRELFASQASITHYCLTRLMHSFDGKVKTVQYRIAEDLQALKPQDEVNIYDLIQIYASMIASVGDSTNKVLALEDRECYNCGEVGHLKKDCPNAQAEGSGSNGSKGGKGGKGGKNREKCSFCGWKGHSESDCRRKKKLEQKVLTAQQPGNGADSQEHAASPAAQQQQPPPALGSKQITHASLAAYLTQLHQAGASQQQLVMPALNVTQSAPPTHDEFPPRSYKDFYDELLSPPSTPVTHAVGSRGDAHIGEASHPGPGLLDVSSSASRVCPSVGEGAPPSEVDPDPCWSRGIPDSNTASTPILHYANKRDGRMKARYVTQGQVLALRSRLGELIDCLLPVMAEHVPSGNDLLELPEAPTISLSRSAKQCLAYESQGHPISTPTGSSESPVMHTVGHRGDAHIGEASHPGPSNTYYRSSFFSYQNRPSMIQWLIISVACVLSIGDGMGCGLMGLREHQADFDKFLAVEISETSRRVARNANPDLEKGPNLVHSWHSDMYEITEEDVAALGPNNIKMFLAGPPCQDFSKLRLIVKKTARKKLQDLRPGLDGVEGRKFRQVIQILYWVLKHNPDCEFLIECVEFEDMKKHWDEINQAIGQPLIINAQVYSHTKRRRSYWTNFVIQDQLPPPFLFTDPNKCMIGNRTLLQYAACGRMNVRPIGATWRGDPDRPYASTSKPVLVNDPDYVHPQHLLPEEAEQLHGMPPGTTAGRGVTNKDRLAAIGKGWDMNVITVLLSFSKLCKGNSTVGSSRRRRQDSDSATTILTTMIQDMNPEEAAECLMCMEPATRQWCLGLIAEQYSPLLTAGAASAHTTVTADNATTAQVHIAGLASANSTASQEESCQDLTELATAAVVAAHNALTPDELAGCLQAMDDEARDWYLSLLASHHMNKQQDMSVLDSGSSKHLQSTVCVTDGDDLTPLSGFDGSTQWTEGKGYVPAVMYDTNTDTTFKVDFEDTDLMTQNLISNIWSMGKLIRDGWKFHLEADNCYGLTPGGAHSVEVQLGMDNILRISHQLRLARERLPLPAQPTTRLVGTVKKSAGDITSQYFHQCFFHRGDEKLTQTLKNTKGYVPFQVKTEHCDACAAAKAREFGLSQSRLPAAVMPVAPTHDEIFDDDDDLDEADSSSDSDSEESEYTAELLGRRLGVQDVPRFDLEKLRPFEAVFIDNKDYPCYVRGGATTCLVFIDYKSRTKHKVDLKSKAMNGSAFRKIAVREGIHKLPYKCRVYTDGCGSMAHVETTAEKLGIDHQYIPPHQQSLNEAEKVCDSIFAETRAAMLHHNMPSHWFSLIVDLAMYTDIRTATTASRGWKTPHEISRGVVPFIGNLHRPATKCFVQVPKSKRKKLAAQGLHNLRAEPGRFVGFHGPYSTTYAVMLDSKGRDRLVHSRSVTFSDDDCIMASKQAPQQGGHRVDMEATPAAPEEASTTEIREEFNPIREQAAKQAPAPNQEDYFDLDDPSNQPWFTHADDPKPRPRPSYNKMCAVMKERAIVNMVLTINETFDAPTHQECMKILTTANPRHETHTKMAHVLAAHSMNDLNWSEVLASENRDKAIAALEDELESLQKTVLTEVFDSQPEFAEAQELATPGRLLLAVKRSGRYKARGVKQGFKEDVEKADGPDFNYYAHVAKFNSIRMSTFRRNRCTRRIAVKDVSTAFLQAHKFPRGVVKYISFKDPLTRKWRYFQQSGPLYGEKSAPRRWEDTIAPWYGEIGYERGENEPCAFYDETNDALSLLYIDDNFIDAEEEDIKILDERLDDRFDCRDIEWLSTGEELDYLGLQLFQTQTHTGYWLEKYILGTLKILGLDGSTKTCSTPISQQIDSDTPALTDARVKLFSTAVGCFGWMSNTCRPDISYAHSRIAQHLSKPTESAWDAIVHCCNYLRGTSDLCIAAPIYPNNRDLSAPQTDDTRLGWEFYSDSDFAGNSEVQNKRRSQNGFIATLNGAPVLWGSKVSSVAFAHPDIGESHADISSGAAEVYAAANATFEFLHLSYTADEMGIPFPKPMTMQIDNKAALAFSDNTAFKSKLKHIDVRQEWVRTLRNKSIVETVHVPSVDNLADLFTKILPQPDFERMRNRIMMKRSSI